MPTALAEAPSAPVVEVAPEPLPDPEPGVAEPQGDGDGDLSWTFADIEHHRAVSSGIDPADYEQRQIEASRGEFSDAMVDEAKVDENPEFGESASGGWVADEI